MQYQDDRDSEPKSTEHIAIPRRRFIVWTAVAATLSAVAAACKDVLTGPSPLLDRLDAPPRNFARGNEGQFALYPAPTYLPPGYELLMEQHDRPDGFRGGIGFGEGIAQVAFVYRGPRAPVSVDRGATRYPLLFFATREQGYRFAGTERADGTSYSLRFDDGALVPSTYYDGMWEFPRFQGKGGAPIAPPTSAKLEWGRSNWHAMVYRWREYTIGLRGSRLCGVSFDELVKVAISTKVEL